MLYPSLLRHWSLSALSILALAGSPVRGDLADDLTKAGASDSLAVAGVDGWLFLRDEARHLSKGPLTPAVTATAVSAIKDYHTALAAQGVQLIVVPVPAKAEIYPEKFSATATASAMAERQADFISALRSDGVSVVDLAAAYHAHRSAHPDERLYCQRDAHWSPAGLELAVREVMAQVKDQTLIKPTAAPATAESIQIKGDLQTTPATDALGLETLSLRKPALTDGTATAASPLLLGDSHTLVFSAGADKGYHCQGAGLPEHLQAQLGQPLLVVANAGGGSDAARLQLARKALPDPGFWTGRKLLIWCFSVRELTEKKWKPVPVVKAK
jgi:alginate O-acetyltransferase complex protein AlgJ